MTVRRLGIVTPTLNTDTDLVTVTDNYLVSVIATNTNSSAPADVRIWVEPSGAATSDEYSYIAYDIEINVGNALETHRFAVNSGDTIRVRATTSDVSFTASGIPQVTTLAFNSEVLDYLDFNTSVTGVTMQEGRLSWNATENTLDVGLGGDVVLQLGEEFYMPKVLNNSGVDIDNGAFVMATGAQGDQITIAAAVTDGSIEPEYMIGIATNTITNGQDDGRVTTHGVVRDIDTHLWPVGTVLYPDPAVAGGLTSTKPDAPNIRTPIAIVLRQHVNTGRIYVRMALGQHLDHDIEDVQITSPSDGQALTYDSASGLWVNTSIDAFPDQTSHSGEFLTTDGSNVSWATVDALPDQTSNNGKYLTTDGTDASWADLDLIPDQTGNSGKYLTTDGTSLSWETIGSAPMQYGTSFPLSPVDGDTFFNYSDGIMYIYLSGAWLEIASAPPLDGGLASTSTFSGSFDGGSSSTTSTLTIDGGDSTSGEVALLA